MTDIAGFEYPLGVVKRTWTGQGPRGADDISMEDVIGNAASIEAAILCSHQYDFDWIASLLDVAESRVSVTLYAQTIDEKLEETNRVKAIHPKFYTIFPPLIGVAKKINAKITLLFRKDFLRLAVSTANLTPEEWGLENTVFVIDLPTRSQEADDRNNDYAFFDDLDFFLCRMSFNRNLLSKLRKYDFSATAEIALVFSLGGFHRTSNCDHRNGIAGLSRAVRQLGLQTDQPLQLDYVTSDVGKLDKRFLYEMYTAAQGEAPEYYRCRSDEEFVRERLSSKPDDYLARTRAYFPSLSTVENSHCGKDGASQLRFYSDLWGSDVFQRHVVHQAISPRPRALVASNMLLVRPEIPTLSESDDGIDAHRNGWAYIGSAAFGRGGWGRPQVNPLNGLRHMFCRNYECGVIVPNRDRRSAEPSESNGKCDGSETSSVSNSNGSNSTDSLEDIFAPTIPVPIQIPASKFDGSQEIPWFYEEQDT